MNVTVIQTVWRRIRRPSGETMRKLRRAESGVMILPAAASNRPAGMGKREANKFARQNMALLYVLDSHAQGHSNLSPGALHVVKGALAPV